MSEERLSEHRSHTITQHIHRDEILSVDGVIEGFATKEKKVHWFNTISACILYLTLVISYFLNFKKNINNSYQSCWIKIKLSLLILILIREKLNTKLVWINYHIICFEVIEY